MNNTDLQFRNRIETRKGTLGEKIVRKYYSQQFPDFIMYKPIEQHEGSHNFDGEIKDKNNFGKTIALFDIKTKPRRAKYQDTGIDVKSYINYKKSSNVNNCPFILFFVDDWTKQIYYQTLEFLDQQVTYKKNKYPMEYNEIIYFPLFRFDILHALTDNQANQLIDLSSMSNKNRYLYNCKVKTVSQIKKQYEGIQHEYLF